MNNFLRRLTNMDVISDLSELNLRQSELVDHLRVQIAFLQLEHARNVRDLLTNFKASLDQDREEVEDLLEKAITDMSDSVARLEEHF